MEARFYVSSSPHIRSKETVKGVMGHVLIALMPATLWGVYIFGLNALFIILASIGAAVLTEYLIQRFMRKQKTTIGDLSAVVTGLLLAMNVPSTAPLWLPIIGSVFAIAIVKQAFGGLGHNFMNPALAARAMLMASWPVQMTNWVTPGADAVSTATPLAIIKAGTDLGSLPTLWDAFMGSVAGCIGETSALLLVLGGVYLLIRGVITIRIPAVYIGTVFILSMLFTGFSVMDSLYGLAAGGLMLGAFFMATDYSSSPVTPMGQWIFAIGCGLITTIVRFKGGYPEGVSYSILLMNVATPLIEKYTAQRVFGGSKK